MQYQAKKADPMPQRTIPNGTTEEKPALNTQAKPFAAPIKPAGKYNSNLGHIAIQFIILERSLVIYIIFQFFNKNTHKYYSIIGANEDDSADVTESFLQAEMAKQAAAKAIGNYEPADGEFTSFPEIHKKTVETLQVKGYKALFPIQQHCFYPVYNREDLIARDLTGSGKTFAFGLPLIEYLRRQKILGTRKLQAIILAPTRELAIQVTNELVKLKHHENDFKVVTVYGGVNIDDQIRQLRQGVDIFVGTTGRVLDHIERGNINFTELKTVVLDEADVMLKLGFKEDVDRILKNVRDVCNKEQL